MVDISIPIYKHPDRVASIIDHLAETAECQHKIIFIIEDDDLETKNEIIRLKCDFVINDRKGCVNRCHNLAFLASNSEFFVISADDIIYPKGWLRDAIDEIGDKGVIAFSDDNAAGWGHFLVRRDYILNQGGTVDGDGIVFHEYAHEYADAEFQFTARSRNEIVYSSISINHKDPRYFGMAIKRGDNIDVVVKKYIIRNNALRFSDIKAYIVQHPENRKEQYLQIDIIPKNPILVSEDYVANKEKRSMYIDTDKKEFEERSHLWGGIINETIFEAK